MGRRQTWFVPPYFSSLTTSTKKIHTSAYFLSLLVPFLVQLFYIHLYPVSACHRLCSSAFLALLYHVHCFYSLPFFLFLANANIRKPTHRRTHLHHIHSVIERNTYLRTHVSSYVGTIDILTAAFFCPYAHQCDSRFFLLRRSCCQIMSPANDDRRPIDPCSLARLCFVTRRVFIL